MPARSDLRLTDRVVKALLLPAKGTKKYRDSELRGFAVQVTAAGGRSWCFIYTSPVTGTERLMTIATCGEMTADKARSEASRLRLMVRDGRDPLEERVSARAEIRTREEAPTILDLTARYIEEHLPNKRPRSAAEDRALIRDYILPALGKHRVADVTKAEIGKMHRAITGAESRTAPIARLRFCAPCSTSRSSTACALTIRSGVAAVASR